LARSKPVSVALLAFCQVAALALWFSASAVVPSLIREHRLTAAEAPLFTSLVQIGFVVGTLSSAALGLADRLDPRRFFMAATLIAAAANASILLVGPGSAVVYLARLLTGVCMAGVYPIGMKLVAGWADGDLGMLVAILVGALTLGSASPHLMSALGGAGWRFTIAASTASALIAAAAINFVPLGPRHARSSAFAPAQILLAFRSRALRLANLGYLGHMWELYAMWTWIGALLAASFAVRSAGWDPNVLAQFTTFVVMGVGGLIGCLAGGWIADRFGRTALTMGAMAASGTCALVVGFLFGAPPLLLGGLCFIWGVTIVADSAQFSASVTELSPPGLVGTMLTAQTCAGFTLTLVTIHLLPVVASVIGWRFAFAPLAIGPYLGVWAMARLRASPEAVKLAGGRR